MNLLPGKLSERVRECMSVGLLTTKWIFGRRGKLCSEKYMAVKFGIIYFHPRHGSIGQGSHYHWSRYIKYTYGDGLWALLWRRQEAKGGNHKMQKKKTNIQIVVLQTLSLNDSCVRSVCLPITLIVFRKNADAYWIIMGSAMGHSFIDYLHWL